MPETVSATHLDVLIISEKPDHLRALMGVLHPMSARVSACFTVRQAQEIFIRQHTDLVLCDECLPDGSYRDLLLASHFNQSAAAFVLLLHKGEWDEYLTAMRLGVFEVLRSPLHRPEVENVLHQVFEHKQKQIAAPFASAPAEPAAELTVEDAKFEEFLERAGAQSNPRGAAATAGAGPSNAPAGQRSSPVRRDVA